MTLSGLIGVLTCELGVLDDMRIDALHQRMLEALVDRPVTPGKVCLRSAGGPRSVVALRNLEQALGRVRAAVQYHVFDSIAEFRGDILVDGELPGIDDP